MCSFIFDHCESIAAFPGMLGLLRQHSFVDHSGDTLQAADFELKLALARALSHRQWDRVKSKWESLAYFLTSFCCRGCELHIRVRKAALQFVRNCSPKPGCPELVT
jgi:hypothetical protein